jgi:hypothetical protein
MQLRSLCNAQSTHERVCLLLQPQLLADLQHLLDGEEVVEPTLFFNVPLRDGRSVAIFICLQHALHGTAHLGDLVGS